MTQATIDDVRDVIDTDLDDPAIQSVLDRLSRDIDREYGEGTGGDTDAGVEFVDVQHRADFEAVLAALRIRGSRDRTLSSVSLGSASKTFDIRESGALRGRVARLDPGDAFSTRGVRRDGNRTVRSTGPATSNGDSETED